MSLCSLRKDWISRLGMQLGTILDLCLRTHRLRRLTLATPPSSLGSGRPDCIGITSGSSISMLGMAIATVMTRLREASFGYGDYNRRSSLCSLVLLRLAKGSLFRLKRPHSEDLVLRRFT